MDGFFGPNEPLANFIYFCGYMQECEMEEPNEDAVEYVPFNYDDNDNNEDYYSEFQGLECILLIKQ